MGFNVEYVAGALKIVDNPELIWSGYVYHETTWYAVDSSDLLAGKIKHSSKIIIPQIEFREE